MRVLVTGGAGFIGSHVAGLLVSRGHQVAVLDDLSTGHRENLPVQASFHRADVQDAAAVREAVRAERPDAVVHLAAQVNLRVSLEDPALDARLNILGSLNVIEAAVREKVRRLVFASSGGAVYGEQEYYPADEEHRTDPPSPYGLAKLTVERYLKLAEPRGLESVILRLSNVYGPRQDPRGEAGVVAIFTQKAIDGERPVVFGDGGQTRDFVYVADVAAAFERALDGPTGVYNVGTGVETSVLSILKLVAHALGRTVEPRHERAIPGELPRSCLQIEKARQELGWSPAVGMGEGIPRTVRHFQSNPA